MKTPHSLFHTKSCPLVQAMPLPPAGCRNRSGYAPGACTCNAFLSFLRASCTNNQRIPPAISSRQFAKKTSPAISHVLQMDRECSFKVIMHNREHKPIPAAARQLKNITIQNFSGKNVSGWRMPLFAGNLKPYFIPLLIIIGNGITGTPATWGNNYHPPHS
jgi:hypothetical protein